MKRFAQLVILSLFYVATWAQPTQVGKYPPMVGEPKREDFPQEVDKQPVNATFTFAILSDLHLSETEPNNTEDVQQIIADINANKQLAFVLVNGDLTDRGDTKSLQLAKKLLSELKIPYYVVPGNHDTRISESGASDFTRLFGDTHFRLFFNGYLFLGINSGPMLQLEDGHVSPQELQWLSHQLKQAGRKQPVYIFTHYPLKKGDCDNWDAVTDLARGYNLQGIFSGHYHRNGVLSYDGIPGIVVRSTQRGTDSIGGYTICSMSDSLYIGEKRINAKLQSWQALPLEKKVYTEGDRKNFPRPNFDINKTYKQVKTVWKKQIDVEIDGAPTCNEQHLFFGDAKGTMHAMTTDKGKLVWQFKTLGAIYGQPALSDQKLVFGSCDRNIYCVNSTDGKLLWKFATAQAVVASPVIENNIVYIGCSDGQFRAIDLNSGKLLWAYKDVKNYVQTKAVISGDKLFFSAWDDNLYALNKTTGTLLWKWESNTHKFKHRPAAVAPVVANNRVFVTNNEHTFTAIDLETGKMLWETKQHAFIHANGASNDGKTVFARCAKDSVLAIDATANTYSERWITDANYGSDLLASVITEQDNQVVFATKNGLICCVNAQTGNLLWQYKLNNTSLHIVPLNATNWLITTRDGLVTRLGLK